LWYVGCATQAEQAGVIIVIEHAAWMGSDYELGLQEQRIAIVGYSHWLGEGDEDAADGTIRCVSRVISGEWKIRFFTQIRNYFGYNDHGAFWQRVMFFNYLPNCVGGANQRFGHGTSEQRDFADDRFRRLIREKLPQKVLVFTSRQWAFPTLESPRQNILPDFPKFSYEAYGVDGHHIAVFFLRHPQGARADLMRRAVKYVLDRPNLDGD